MQENARSWTYVLVTPDGLLTGYLPWLLDSLQCNGLAPVAGRLIRVTSATMLNIYAPPGKPFPSRLPPRRKFDLWYGLGPGCVLLLHRDGDDACAAMSEFKGATNPREAGHDTIRHHGENCLTNIVHCPDNEAQAADELAQLVGEKSAVSLQRLANSPDERVRRLTVDSLEDSLPAYSGPEALSTPLIVNKLRLRVVGYMAAHESATSAVLSTLTETRETLRREHSEIRQQTTSADRADIARTYDDQLQSALVGIARQLGDTAAEDTNAGIATITRLFNEARLLEDGGKPSTPPDSGAQENLTTTLREQPLYVAETELAALELSM
ncbi:MAG: hypothetical protein GEU97_17285 [Actinophytocola sp.]|nr:hypothetical protein [Actinophytocola sp.]